MSHDRQVIALGGQAAGRDINNNHTTVMHPAPTESQLQAEFAERAGIWCPKPAREWLEHLLDHHAFTVRELRASWRANSIGWSAEKNERRINTPRLEAVFIYGVLGFVALGFLQALVRYFNDDARGSLLHVLSAFGELAFYMVCFVQFAIQMLWPRRVALRVARVCSQCTINKGEG